MDQTHGRTCLYAGEALARYGFGEGHPFGPDRQAAFLDEAGRRGLLARAATRAPVAAEASALLRFHDAAYLERLRTQSRTGEGFLDWGDTPAFPGIYEAAAYVAGSVLDGLEQVMRGGCRRAFVPIAGLHHARRDGAAGFCAVNDCGIALETLLGGYGLERVAYVDIDAHHGDGVLYAFEDDPRVVIADVHEDGRYLYPGTGGAAETGKGLARGTKLNIPMPPGADDAAFARAWPRVEAHLRAHPPGFILFQCGADSLAGDPITHLAYTEASHALAARTLCRLADELCAGRLLAMGGGGYKRANLAAAWSAVLEALAGPPDAVSV